MKLYLVRHGQTINNVNHIIGGNNDFPLTELGIKQAHEVAERLDDIDAIYSSALNRAKITAEIIGEHKGVKPKVCSELNEIDFGDFKGLTFAEVKEKYYDEYMTFRNDFSNFQAPNGESVEQVKERIKSIYEILLHGHFDDTVAIVAHQIVIRAFVDLIFNIPDLPIRLTNTGFITILINEDYKTFVC